MELEKYLRTLQRWWWLILVCTLCTGGASFIANSLMQPVYEARVTLMSNQSANTGIVDYPSLLGSRQIIETSRELLQTQPLLETVIRNLDLPYSAEDLAENIEVDIVHDTQLLRLTVEDTSPARAAGIANEIAQTFLLQRSTEQPDLEIENYERAVVEQMRALDQSIESTAEEIEQLRGSSSPQAQERLAALQSQQTQQRSAYADFLAGFLNIRSMKSRSLSLVIVEPAQISTDPVRPRKVLTTGVAAGGGFALACAMAFLLEYLNDTFESPDELQDVLSLPNLGTIPVNKSWQKDGHVRVAEEAWPTMEAFRILRTNIQFASVDAAVRKLLVTSSAPREGKTSITTYLGVVSAQGGRKVLLVDADLRQPTLHRAFDVSNKRGLTDLLVRDGDQSDYILTTAVDNLYLLPSGSLPPNPSELLASQRMAQLIDELESFADLVLFDAPPVLACADAMILASQVDGVLLVVDGSATRPDAAQRALGMLRNAEARVLGGILNKMRGGRANYYYYYSDRDKSENNLGAHWRNLTASIRRSAHEVLSEPTDDGENGASGQEHDELVDEHEQD